MSRYIRSTKESFESVEDIRKTLSWFRRIRRGTRRGMQEKPFKQLSDYQKQVFKDDCHRITHLSGKIIMLEMVVRFLDKNDKLTFPSQQLDKLKAAIIEFEKGN